MSSQQKLRCLRTSSENVFTGGLRAESYVHWRALGFSAASDQRHIQESLKLLSNSLAMRTGEIVQRQDGMWLFYMSGAVWNASAYCALTYKRAPVHNLFFDP